MCQRLLCRRMEDGRWERWAVNSSFRPRSKTAKRQTCSKFTWPTTSAEESATRGAHSAVTCADGFSQTTSNQNEPFDDNDAGNSSSSALSIAKTSSCATPHRSGFVLKCSQPSCSLPCHNPACGPVWTDHELRSQTFFPLPSSKDLANQELSKNSEERTPKNPLAI